MENTWKMHEKTCFTIEEIVALTGRSSTSIYRYIKSGKLKANKVKGDGKPSYIIPINEVEDFFGIDWKKHEKNMFNTENTMKKTWKNHENEKPLTQETLMETMEKFFSSKQSELVKPMEQQALYKLGKVEQENLFLKQKLETILEENRQLQEQIKALPGPVESIQQVLQENSQNLTLLQKEKEDLLTQVEEYKHLPEKLEDTVRKLREKENEIKAIELKLQKEKEETEARLLREKEEAIKEQKVKLLQEKAEAEARIKSEKEEIEIRLIKETKELEARLKSEEEEKSRAKVEAEEALKQLTSLPAPVESIHQILLDNANNIKELAKEKDSFQSVLKEHEATIKEKERALKDIEELRRQELEQVKKQAEEKEAKIKAEAEEREKQIAEAWKKELEEAKKPWWKKLW